MEPPTIVLLLRGHIRDSFKDKILFNFVRELGNIYNVKIYIHTWNIYSTRLSWREVKDNNNNVTMIDIVTYFNGVKCTFKHIDIDDDSKINLIGDTSGNVFSS